MSREVPTRDEAFASSRSSISRRAWSGTPSPSRASCATWRRKRGEDEGNWGVIGLVHDLDYEKSPE